MGQIPLKSTGSVLPLRITWFMSTLLLVMVGITLLFFPGLGVYFWPWPLAPFNTRLLGAIYTSAMLPLISYLVRPRLSSLRIILPIFTCFTTYFLVASIVHSAYFSPRRSAFVWLILYGIDSFVGLYYCWRLRHSLKVKNPSRVGSYLYRGQSILLIGYGFGLVLFASSFGQWWPWPLDEFHSRLYGGVLLTSALAMELLRDRATGYDRFWFGWTQFCLGGLSAWGLWWVDLKMKVIDWSSVYPWLWQLVFLVFAGIGGWIMSREAKEVFRNR